MNILICNERFLFRFGMDRVLILLGKYLKELGHTISIMGNQYDQEIVKNFASQIIDVPTCTNEYVNLNEFTSEWLGQKWHHYFSQSVPDIVFVGGWPFLSSIPFFRKAGSKVIFIDFGAVPLQGYAGDPLRIQEKLRALRKQYLKEATRIISISDFIANSQSKIDSEGKIPVHSVLLGADHLEMPVWQDEKLQGERGREEAAQLLGKLRLERRPTLLNLGRWEPGCYKNSEAAFDILGEVKKVFPTCALLILAERNRINIPPSLKDSVFAIGFPDDHELVHLMKGVDVGISVSQWEGFNLPLTEMQWLDRPALAFDLAAHPEVILHPWYLCRDTREMTEKVCAILSGGGLDSDTRGQSLEKFRKHFIWTRVVRDYQEILEQMMGDRIGETPKLRTAHNERISGKRDKGISLIVDVTNSTRDPANSGVIRVTRRLCKELQGDGLDPIFVVWSEELKSYVLPMRAEYQQLGQFNGPTLTHEKRLSPDGRRVGLLDIENLSGSQPRWLLFPETVQEKDGQNMRRFARDHGMFIGAIFYDAIPILHPEFCNEEIRTNHAKYMAGLAECDVVIPISNFSADSLKNFWKERGIEGCPVIPNALAGEFSGVERNKEIQEIPFERIKILCVSTLEPRKNHMKLIEACLLLEKKYPNLNWSLTLVGNRYAGAFDLAERIQSICARNSRIKWVGIVDDVTLDKLYREATFTVYPSLIEGFGLPILESIWHGRSCICYQEGVMGEIATEGGCLTTDVTNEEALSDAIYRLATDRELFQRLSKETVTRRIKTWEDYMKEFFSILESFRNSQFEKKIEKSPSLQEILYPGCLCNHWQMNDSERLALTALLTRHHPQCSIEIGTYQGGSLSLISQFSETVFSVDIDPTIPSRFKQFKNVSFLTGPSSVILPLLFKELDEAGIPVDFILIDGDHSAEGIKRDISCILSYVPQKPLFVLIHDSFNPECRRGMLEVNWTSSSYVHWVDIDFIPGRIVEQGGPFQGQMWGGLALAYLKPERRINPFKIIVSAHTMHEKLKTLSND